MSKQLAANQKNLKWNHYDFEVLYSTLE